ncbi:hypothetical protein ACFQ0O_30360 [Saccharopolyspora spinosporotrichia]
MLAVIGLLSTTFGVAVASALMPLISVELFVIGLVLKGPEVPWWALALVIAVGQIAGKMLYFYAARGSSGCLPSCGAGPRPRPRAAGARGSNASATPAASARCGPAGCCW